MNHRPIGRLRASVLAGISLSLAVWALAWAAADLSAGAGRRIMAGWQRPGAMISADAAALAQSRLAWAARVNDLRAEYQADLARAHAWQAWLLLADAIASERERQESLRLIARALALRPGWGNGWAQLAEQRILSHGPDGEALWALRRAVDLAPWDPGVQQRVIAQGMAVWDQLTPELQGVVAGTVVRALRIEENVPALMRLAAQYGWEDRLIPLLKHERQRAALRDLARSYGVR